MAFGTLKADTLTHSTAGSVDTNYVVNGSAKAWVNFDTGDNPPVLDGSFGVSSLTDNATEIEVNLTSAMSDIYYAPVSSGGSGTVTNPSNRLVATNAQTTTKVDTEMYTAANANETGHNHIVVHGDLA
jgi:hypothetical protein